MSAREDYPLLAWMEGSAPWPEGPKATLAESVTGALSHIDALRPVVHAALTWRRCKYAAHANTSEASRNHAIAVQFAERLLSDRIAELLGGGAALTGDCDGCPVPTDGCPGDCPQRAQEADHLAWWRSQQ